MIAELLAIFDKKKKKTPNQIWKALGSPKYILAPMVLQSELPFRMMCRKYGTTLTYSPMLTAKDIITDFKTHGNLSKHIRTCKADRPLVVQLCSSTVDDLVNAAIIIQNNIECDAIDINLGCPRERAERDTFGAFLLSKPALVRAMVSSLVQHPSLHLPIFAKIRLLPTFHQTLEFVQMLDDAGISCVAIHGRQIDAKNDGMANLTAIKKIKQHCKHLPIISNGNIATFADAQKNLEYTQCDGVMSATGLRINPHLFDGAASEAMHCIDVCWEYLEFVRVHGVIHSHCVNKHILQICRKYLLNGEYENGLECEKKRRQIGLLRKLLRWSDICTRMIQYESILDMLERIVDKEMFRHPKIKIFTVQQIKKQPGYILYWHRQNKKLTKTAEMSQNPRIAAA